MLHWQADACQQDPSPLPRPPGSGTKCPTRASTMSSRVTPSRPASSVRSQLRGPSGPAAAAAAAGVASGRRRRGGREGPGAAAGVAPVGPRHCARLIRAATWCNRTVVLAGGAETGRALQVPTFIAAGRELACEEAFGDNQRNRQQAAGEKKSCAPSCRPGETGRKAWRQNKYASCIVTPRSIYSKNPTCSGRRTTTSASTSLFSSGLLHHVSCSRFYYTLQLAVHAPAPCMQAACPPARSQPPPPPPLGPHPPLHTLVTLCTGYTESYIFMHVLYGRKFAETGTEPRQQQPPPHTHPHTHTHSPSWGVQEAQGSSGRRRAAGRAGPAAAAAGAARAGAEAAGRWQGGGRRRGEARGNLQAPELLLYRDAAGGVSPRTLGTLRRSRRPGQTTLAAPPPLGILATVPLHLQVYKKGRKKHKPRRRVQVGRCRPCCTPSWGCASGSGSLTQHARGRCRRACWPRRCRPVPGGAPACAQSIHASCPQHHDHDLFFSKLDKSARRWW